MGTTMANTANTGSTTIHSIASETGFCHETVTAGGREWMRGYLSVDDGGQGIYRNEATEMIYYTKRAALRVAMKLRGWRIPESDDFEALNDGGFRDIGLKESGSADITEGEPEWFGKNTPYLMGLTAVMFVEFGRHVRTFGVSGDDIAPVKLIREAVPMHTYSTPLVSGVIWDYGNFAGSWWSSKSYKYDEMHGKVSGIVKESLEKARRNYPDCECAMYIKISAPWARQSCMMVEYRVPREVYRSMKDALEPTAVCLDDDIGPCEVENDIYNGRKGGYFVRVPG